jgi:hypothetical protein
VSSKPGAGQAAVFVIGILSNSKACGAAKRIDDTYKAALEQEFTLLQERLKGADEEDTSGSVISPLANKEGLVNAFDAKLKGLQ